VKTYILNELTSRERHHLMLSAVAPRPIAFASTIDKAGRVNLSPFSFFNLFSTNPPIAIFSPSRSRDGSLKHTHLNVLEVPEVCINLVSYEIIQPMSLSSNTYPRGVNEFIKAGLSMEPCRKIKPPLVREAPVAMECTVEQVVPLGGEGASGNLIICRVLLIHVQEKFLDKDGQLDTTKIDLVGRMGGNWYCRAFGDALFEVPKPGASLAIGIDQLPAHIRKSNILSANDLGVLGSLTRMPEIEEIQTIKEQYAHLETVSENPDLIHREIKLLIRKGRPAKALALAYWLSDDWPNKTR
jgi:flavin reductase (DIM6/NTAB) family NADH-FMN oxidoreductase RutF